MTIYDDLKPVVSELLSEFKQGTIQLVKITPGTGAIDDPGEPTETIYTLDATVSGVSFKYVKASLAVASDLMVTAAPVPDVVIGEDDFLIVDGLRYKIVQDMSKPSAGDRLVWKLIARKGS